MDELRSIVCHLLATREPHAAVLDRSGAVVAAPHGAPGGGPALRESIARLGAGEEHVVHIDEQGAQRWRLEPIREEGDVMAVVAAPLREGMTVRAAAAETSSSVIDARVLSPIAEAQRSELERLVVERSTDVVRSEARLRAVLDTVSEVILGIDHHGFIESCNRAVRGLLGYSTRELIGRHLTTLLPELELLDEASPGEGPLEEIGREMIARANSGAEIPVRLQLSGTRVDGEHLYVAVLQDLRSEARAREALHYRAALVDSMTDAVISTNLQFEIITWSSGAESIYGWTAAEAIGRRIGDLLDSQLPVDIEDAQAQLLEDGVWQGEAVQTRKDGSPITVSSRVSLLRDAEGRPVGVLAVNSDVTAIRQLQAQYAHIQKMEALGRLTAGIAHDFGNLLMGISGTATLALSQIDGRGPAARNLRALIEAVKRGAGLSRQLMSFSRKKGELRAETLNLDALVATTRSLLERLVDDDVELVTELKCPDGHVLADPSQLEQILVNLIINAADAMPRGGTITVETEEVQVLAEDVERRGLPAGGRYVRLMVCDTGQGMDEAIKSRLFEPFFTTKPVGQGTGLGLSTVYAFTKEMGGGIEVHSSVGRGTSFFLYFPWAEVDTRPSDEQERLPGGTETVLLVEDEKLVRLTVLHHLESLGYSVIEATGPSDALSACEQRPETIDLLLSDVVMPEMGGLECARRAKEIRPGLHVLFMSAHSQEHLLARGSLEPGDDILHKPFSRAELAVAMRKILDTPKLDPTPERAPSVAPPGGGATVLIVDDAELMLMSVSDCLRTEGYAVATATNGEDALVELSRRPGTVDVALIDFTLPDIRGTALAETIRQREPRVEIIYMSGFPRSHANVGDDEIWLEKPVRLSGVLEAIVAVLSRRAQ